MLTLPGETFAPDLPPQLTEAPREFAKWANGELLSEQRKQYAIRTALPTTRAKRACAASFRARSFGAFSHLHQSDPTEFQYSLCHRASHNQGGGHAAAMQSLPVISVCV